MKIELFEEKNKDLHLGDIIILENGEICQIALDKHHYSEFGYLLISINTFETFCIHRNLKEIGARGDIKQVISHEKLLLTMTEN